MGKSKQMNPSQSAEKRQATEKRRHQLRVAQQAFRKRKDTAIADLQKQVDELQGGIDDLSSSFLSFSELLLKDEHLGHSPHVAQSLWSLSQQFVALAKRSREEDNEDNDVDASISGPDPEKEDQSAKLSALSQTTPPATLYFPLPSPVPSPPLDLDILPNPTLSFAQNLVLACFQKAHRLLLRSPRTSLEIQEVFGTALSASERDRTVALFQEILADFTGHAAAARTNILTLLQRESSPKNPVLFEGLPSMARFNSPEYLHGKWVDAYGVQRILLESGLLLAGVGLDPFIQRLSLMGICAGPGPVFRRESVDRVLIDLRVYETW
ncbi:hypothetical protein N7474_005324 [Penicillium riverlandense]|uniref:uncharacterized protein n=1 Tax=Penicillium riverlandense TaxID=1903569 RepID=UPI0025471C08|nr:uncharacterized protein N7474_005324 [Penicillium riverlandense]KAJ5819733.1 hypothetical protein N7474_005324 [Penicillium riverlandense]